VLSVIPLAVQYGHYPSQKLHINVHVSSQDIKRCKVVGDAIKKGAGRILLKQDARSSFSLCRSAIFYHDAEQQTQGNEVKDVLQKTKIKDPIVTDIVPFENWWDAEAYHQEYLVNNPGIS